MTEDRRRSSNGDGLDHTTPTDSSLDDLREILFGRDMTRLEGELDDLEQRLTDRDTLIAIIAPVLGDAIRRQIRDARDEMIEALYPILGQLVALADMTLTINSFFGSRSSFSVPALQSACNNSNA